MEQLRLTCGVFETVAVTVRPVRPLGQLTVTVAGHMTRLPGHRLPVGGAGTVPGLHGAVVSSSYTGDVPVPHAMPAHRTLHNKHQSYQLQGQIYMKLEVTMAV